MTIIDIIGSREVNEHIFHDTTFLFKSKFAYFIVQSLLQQWEHLARNKTSKLYRQTFNVQVAFYDQVPMLGFINEKTTHTLIKLVASYMQNGNQNHFYTGATQSSGFR